MSGQGLLDGLGGVYKSILDLLGGTCDIEIVKKTGRDPLTGQSTGTETVSVTGVAISPPSPYIESTVAGSDVQTGLLSGYISDDDLGGEIIVPKFSYCTLKVENGVDKKYMITRANPVITGNNQAGFELILQGLH